jgi:CHAT domain-containing protein/tetratricopeptide (TPR) repeat protein
LRLPGSVVIVTRTRRQVPAGSRKTATVGESLELCGMDETPLGTERVGEAIGAFVAASRDEAVATYERYAETLRSAAAAAQLERNIEHYRDDPETADLLRNRYALLARAGEVGIHLALLEMDPPPPEAMQALVALVNAAAQGDWPQIKHSLTQESPFLLGQQALESLTALAAQHRNDPQIVRTIEATRQLLSNARSSGVAAALESLRQHLRSRLHANVPTDGPTMTGWLSVARSLADPDSESAEWLDLTLRLADRLVRADPDEAGTAAERAISLLEEALMFCRDRGIAPRHPGIAEAHLGLLYLKRGAGDEDRGLARLEEAAQLLDADPDRSRWAAVQLNLANAYRDRTAGDRAANRAIALSCYERAQQVFTREEAPQHWAGIQRMLGDAYSEVEPHESHGALERAVSHYRAAESVSTRETDPANWLNIQLKLGYVLRRMGRMAEASDRFRAVLQLPAAVSPTEWGGACAELATDLLSNHAGDRPRRIEEVIELFKNALTVIPPALGPRWGVIHRNLAMAYRERAGGDRQQNLELARDHSERALEVWTREAYPYEWAQIQHNLGTVYYERVQGERADNLEQAIAHYRQALTVHTRESYPRDWALTSNALGAALHTRVAFDRVEDRIEAFQSLQGALSVWEQVDDPFHLAECLNMLGAVQLEEAAAEVPGAASVAVSYLERALAIYTSERYPERRAETQSNLGAAYAELSASRPEYRALAIEQLRLALSMLSRERQPHKWAEVAGNLAAALVGSQGLQPGGDEEPLSLLTQALAVHRLEEVPAQHRRTQSHIGHVHFTAGRWSPALRAYSGAIEAGNELFRAAYTPAGRRAEVAEVALLYARSAWCLLQLGRPDEALVRLEAGKTRQLAESLALNVGGIASLPERKGTEIASARTRVRQLEASLSADPIAADPGAATALSSELRLARDDLKRLIESCRHDHPEFMPAGLDLAEILALAPAGGALVAPVITDKGGAAFILPAGLRAVGPEHVLQLAGLDDAAVLRLVLGSREEPGWLPSYAVWKERRDLDRWQHTITRILAELWERFGAPLHRRLDLLGVTRQAPVVLLPQRWLGLLPLHAASPGGDGRPDTLLDLYQLSYAPGTRVLDSVRRGLLGRPVAAERLLMVVNPTEDLAYARIEGRAVAAEFERHRGGGTDTLPGQKATASRLMQVAPKHGYLHFACHGYYDPEEVMRSALVLAGGEPFALPDIAARLDLDGTRLATLSACETGMTEYQRSPEEYFGLPGAFLQAGASAVISSLWAVADLSTMLLIERAYANHLDGTGPAAALRSAQLWLRDARAELLAARVERELQSSADASSEDYVGLSDAWRRLAALDPNDRPFAHPFFWAAFTCTGA